MKTFLIFIIRVYQKVFSPDTGRLKSLYFSPILNLNTGSVWGCRSNPTCSEYAINSIKEHGVVAGLVKAGRRLARCA